MEIKVAKPPWSALGRKLESCVRKALYDFHMLDGVERLSIALSGGKDSLTLLFLLNAIRGRGFPNFKIFAIHVSGEFSCGAGVDIPYLNALCQSIDVPLEVVHTLQKQTSLECYSCSRERRSLIFSTAKKLNAPTIAFGHHRDDHVQTILMNLLHKGEFAGNLPKIFMHQYQTTLIRPLIYVEEKDIRSFAMQQGFSRIMCQCPIGQQSMRKKTEKLIQEIELVFPNARANIAQGGLLYGSKKASKHNLKE